MKDFSFLVLLIIFIAFLFLNSGNAQELTTKEKINLVKEKELIKKLSIKSKTLMVYVYTTGIPTNPEGFKSLHESCIYDTSGNKVEDYYFGFEGKFHKVNYSYDFKDRLKRRQTLTLDGLVTGIVNFEYDNRDNLIREVWLSSKDTAKEIKIYEYDTVNKLIRKTNFGNLLIKYQYEYDRFENLVNIMENNSFEPVHNYGRILKYDTENRIIERKNLDSDGEIGSVFSFKYDDSGNIVEEYIDWKDIGYQDKKGLYEYDDKNNLIKLIFYEGEKQRSNTTFHYDQNGLLIEKLNFDGKNALASKYKYVYEYY